MANRPMESIVLDNSFLPRDVITDHPPQIMRQSCRRLLHEVAYVRKLGCIVFNSNITVPKRYGLDIDCKTILPAVPATRRAASDRWSTCGTLWL